MSLGGAFHPPSAPGAMPPPISPAPARRNDAKRPPSFSLRLSADERARLEAEARGAPLGACIKAKLTGGDVPVRMRRSGLAVEDRQALV